MVSVLSAQALVTILPLGETTLVRHACAITRRGMRLGPAAAGLMNEIVVECERAPVRRAR